LGQQLEVQRVGRSTPEDDAAGVLAEGSECGFIVEAIDHGLLSGSVAKVIRLLDGLFATPVEAA
jgi:hypothetical protein